MALTLALNLLATSLIIYRICAPQKQTSPYRVNVEVRYPLSRAMRIIIESGLLYTLSMVILMILFLAKSNAQLAVKDAVRFLSSYSGITSLINTTFAGAANHRQWCVLA